MPTNVISITDGQIFLEADLVITSYSIHYTKLYEDGCGSPVRCRFTGHSTVKQLARDRVFHEKLDGETAAMAG